MPLGDGNGDSVRFLLESVSWLFRAPSSIRHLAPSSFFPAPHKVAPIARLLRRWVPGPAAERDQRTFLDERATVPERSVGSGP